MARNLTVNDAKQSLIDHVAFKGTEIREKYGPDIGWKELLQILEDRSYVRYPCTIEFNSAPLQADEFAHPVAIGERPEDGFIIYVRPIFTLQLERVPYLVLYQLVLVNYGDFASPDDAETFGANALGISKDEYYYALCDMMEEIT